jgi:hypothetical protein
MFVLVSFGVCSMNRPAAPTLDGLTRRRYHYWAGASGRSYIHGAFTPGERPHFASAALVLIARDAGRQSVVDIAATGDLPELYFNGRVYARALRCGVSEVHVHLADDAAAARRAAADIAAGLAPGTDAEPARISLAGEAA